MTFETFWTWTVTEVTALVSVALTFVCAATFLVDADKIFTIVAFWNNIITDDTVADKISAESGLATTSLFFNNSFLALGASDKISALLSFTLDSTVSVALTIDTSIVSW